MLSEETQRHLTSAANLLLRSTLHDHGNVLSNDHGKALYELCSTLTEYAAGTRTGRQVWPLPTGAGKTSALICWTAALCKLGGELEDVSISISASKVESLSKIKDALVKLHGVPEELIGIKHSYGNLPGIWPSTGDSDRKVVLLTHQRVRGGTTHDLFTQHKGAARNVMIYDESLFKSDSIAIDASDVDWGIGGLKAAAKQHSQLLPVIQYLEACQALVEAELQQAASGACAGEVTLPDLSELERVVFPELIRSAARKTTQRQIVDCLIDLVAFSGSPMRVASVGQGKGLLWAKVAVPDELENVLVLDASYPIRKLMQLDRTLTRASDEFRRDEQIKRFDNVTIHQMFAPGGRGTVAESFLKEKREERAVSREVVEVVRQTPSDHPVLIVIFKDHSGAIRRNLLADLRDAGVDTEAKVVVRGVEKDRINIATWGSHDSSNDFSHCRVVVLAGVLHRSLLDIASAAMGQLDDRKVKLDVTWLNDLVRSEVAHCVYQALSRGSCREVDRGQAKPMDAYVILPWPLEPRLKEVMPGAQYRTWEPVHAASIGRDGVTVRLAMTIRDHLTGLPESIRKVSSRALKETLGVPEEQRDSFKRAVKMLEDFGGGWVGQGRSLVREAEAFGFTVE